MKKVLLAASMVGFLIAGCGPSTKQEPVVTESLSTEFTRAAGGDHRSAKNIARNVYRHPVETLGFFELKPGMTVLEISPGGMWYTEILAPALKGRGTFIVAGYDTSIAGQPKYRYRQQQAMEQRFAEQPEHYSEVKIVKFSPPDSVQLGENGSVDRVLTFRNFHGWVRAGVALSNLKAFYNVLKPGGVLGVVQHRTDKAKTLASGKINGYLTEPALIELAESAGFVLDARSEINANAKDDREHEGGVWSLPPTLRLGDKDREKYLAIGESDRMTLRFKKPE